MENETNDFRGLLYYPTLESEVVMLFSLLIPRLSDSYIIEEGDRGFPDCFALRNGQKVGIEFELYSNNFYEHKHDQNDDLTKCNIIVCWQNNIPNTTKKDGKEFLKVKGHQIEIISLEKQAKSLGVIKLGERPNIFRKSEERFFEQLEELKSKKYDLIQQLYQYAKQKDKIEIQWGGGERYSSLRFFVGNPWNINPISVYGNGKVEIMYQENDSQTIWKELPQETKNELKQIFKRFKHKWHHIPLNNEVELDNIKKALDILSEHSKRFEIIIHKN